MGDLLPSNPAHCNMLLETSNGLPPIHVEQQYEYAYHINHRKNLSIFYLLQVYEYNMTSCDTIDTWVYTEYEYTQQTAAGARELVLFIVK